MSGHDDAEEERRYKPPYNTHKKIPTISKFRKEKEARKAEAQDHGGDVNGDDVNSNGTRKPSHNEKQRQDGGAGDETQEQQRQEDADARDGAQADGSVADETQPAIDTSEVDAAATDPKQRRKQLKKGKEERAERQVTDPVTHLPVTIHDLTSHALKEVPENDEPFGSTPLTATGPANKNKSIEQLLKELLELQRGYDSMQSLFPPPNFHAVKKELVSICQVAVSVVMTGLCIVVIIVLQIWKLFETERFTKFAAATRDRPWLSSIIMWPVIIGATLGLSVPLVYGVKNWIAKRADTIWEEEMWDASRKTEQKQARGHETETVAWLNSLLGSVWPLINPDLFTSLADTLEDVMQASLPKMVQMVSVNDIGQGSQSIRILGIRWLPTAAAARSITQDGKLKEDGGHSNDRKVPGQGETEDDSGNKNDETQQQDDGSQQQIAEGMEAEEGDFVNLEVAFSYRARPNKRSLSMKDRAKDMHLYVAFYLPGNIKVPVWVDLRGIVGTMRMRLQLCPDPPFFSLCTVTFLGQPKVDISCTPLSRHALNLMDVPLISNFVQSAVDAAMAEYVAPKSLNLDLKDMLAGDDFKKDTNARGVLVVNIKRGYDFKMGDQGIPLVKDGSSDPYVSVGWAKFGKPVWSTRLLLNEMEPWWDETAHVLVTPEELNVHERLRLQLWDSDRLTADDDLGRIEVDLKELMKNEQSDGKMWKRTDGFRALHAGETMPGKLEWSVGYFSKTPIQAEQLKRQTFDPEVHNMEELKQKVDRICDRKLREADVKKGRHKHDADEIDQQRAQEQKEREDAMTICTPPPDGYPSGIFSIQIHQITGLELEKISKAQQDKQGEVNDEEEEGEGLPSAYCTVIINHSKVFKTRTKPKNAKPFYNAGTERFIADWRNTEVYVSVRDARVKEDDALLGIVHLPLGEMFGERSQLNGFYPLTGGIGYGRVRLSMVWRSVQLQAPPEAIGWQYGTVELQPSVSGTDLPEDLRAMKLKFHTDLSSGKMYAGKEGDGWKPRKDQSLKLAVRKRYSSCLAIQFRHHAMSNENTAAFAVFWLKDIADEMEQEVSLPVWKGDYERATKCTLSECGEKVGSLKLKLTFWDGLGSAHSRWAKKDQNLQDIIEVLDTARDNLEEMKNEKAAGVVDGNATDSSSDEDNSDDESGSQIEGAEKKGKHNPIKQVKEYKNREKGLNRRNRGVMQWKIPRTAQWAAHKVDHTETKLSGIFKHHTRQPGVETES